jgi:ABC-type amino acid transport substrate-binding protein
MAQEIYKNPHTLSLNNTSCTRRTAVLAGLIAGASLVAGTGLLVGCSSGAGDGTSGADGSSDGSAGGSGSSATSAKDKSAAWILQEEGKLKVSAWLDYMPFEGESGFKTVGFSYDLMEEIAANLGLELEYLSSTSQERAIAAVLDGSKVDIAVSSLLPSDVEKAGALATNAYLELGLAVVANKKSEFDGLDSLTGKTLGIVPGTMYETWARGTLSDCTFVECEDWTFLYAALQAENVDSIVSSLEVAKYFLRLELTSAEIIHSEDYDEKFVMALAPENTALCDAINNALADLKENGTYQALYDEWFNTTSVDTTTESRTPEQGAPGYAKGA